MFCAEDVANESATSDDYALPPDASGPETESTVASATCVTSVGAAAAAATAPVAAAPATQLSRISTLERCSSSNSSSNPSHGHSPAAGQDYNAGGALQKAGYLTKLSGKLKTWRKRWFVLHNGVLSYWKCQSDQANRKAQGQIVLDDGCRVARADGAATFEIATLKKTYYLSTAADSSATVDEWVRLLQNVVDRRQAARLQQLMLAGRDDEHKPTLQGWLVKVKHGHSKRCWCVLVGKMFLYFKSPSDQVRDS